MVRALDSEHDCFEFDSLSTHINFFDIFLPTFSSILIELVLFENMANKLSRCARSFKKNWHFFPEMQSATSETEIVF